MQTEYEATFTKIDRQDLTKKLKALNAALERPEYLQRRVTLDLPKENRRDDTWLRVRDEYNKVTLTLKSVSGKTIEGQKEILITVDNFDDTINLLTSIGCEKKSYQESKRELWRLGNIEVSIDTWPFLDTYVEIEGPGEEEVKEAAKIMDLDYKDAMFTTVSNIYKQKYGKTLDELNKEVLKSFTFQIENPFL